jgi:hypothetical protein
MLVMVDEYSNTLLSYSSKNQDESSSNKSLALDDQRLIPVQEQWRQTNNKRDHGHYTKAPEQPVH